jgi:4-hydroxybenzoate polyprenyltransferase
MIISASNMGELENQLGDYESDKKAKISTTAGRFGKKISKYICYFSAAVFVLSLFFIAVFFNEPLILFFSPLPVFRIYSMRNLFN